MTDPIKTALDALQTAKNGLAWYRGECPQFASSSDDEADAEIDAAITALEGLEKAGPVLVYHGRCVIDCGDNGHHDVELLRMIPKGTKLYTQPAPLQDEPAAAQPQGEVVWPVLEQDAKVGGGTFRRGVSARLAVESAYRQAEYAAQEKQQTEAERIAAEMSRRALWDLLHPTATPQPAMPVVPHRPDILEKLTYHALERDDLTLDECLSYLAKGWYDVRGRTEREMVLQLTALLATAPPSPAVKESLTDAQSNTAHKSTLPDDWRIHKCQMTKFIRIFGRGNDLMIREMPSDTEQNCVVNMLYWLCSDLLKSSGGNYMEGGMTDGGDTV